MSIIMQPENMQKIKSASGGQLNFDEVYLRAVTLLKNNINQRWGDQDEDKENVSQNTPKQHFGPSLSENYKGMVKQNIFTALDKSMSKQIS